MALWLVLALMTAAASFAVLWPLGRTASHAKGPEQDIAVYRDQLEELDHDQAQGLISLSDAKAARVEVSRRLLNAADTAKGEPAPPTPAWRRKAMAVAALVVLPIATASLYLVLGSPSLPGFPVSERADINAERRSIEGMLAQIEGHLSRHPEDGRGWEVLAPVYMQLSRFQDAVKARRNALRLLGADATREADLGEAIVASANGVVTQDAKESFQRSASADPKIVKAQFFLGLAAEQDGNRKKAMDIWQALLVRQDIPPDWRNFIAAALARASAAEQTPAGDKRP